MNGFPGDLILYPASPRSALASRLVAAGELLLGSGHSPEEYSHVAILAYGNSTYEAKWPRTALWRIDYTRPFEVWRLDGITDVQRYHILHWCREHLGEWYDLLGLVTGGLLRGHHAQVCSTFAGAAYASVGVRFHKTRHILSPNDLVSYPNLKQVWASQDARRKS